MVKEGRCVRMQRSPKGMKKSLKDGTPNKLSEACTDCYTKAIFRVQVPHTRAPDLFCVCWRNTSLMQSQPLLYTVYSVQWCETSWFAKNILWLRSCKGCKASSEKQLTGNNHCLSLHLSPQSLSTSKNNCFILMFIPRVTLLNFPWSGIKKQLPNERKIFW